MKNTVLIVLGRLISLLLIGMAYVILRHSSRQWLR
jgi:hypothetical protein